MNVSKPIDYFFVGVSCRKNYKCFSRSENAKHTRSLSKLVSNMVYETNSFPKYLEY